MQLLAELTLIFSIAAFILYISARLKVPSIIGLIFSGLVVGPYGLGFIQSDADIQVLAEIGILLLLFTIGVEFSVEKLSKNLRWIILGGGVQFFLTVPGSYLWALYGWDCPAPIHLYWLPFCCKQHRHRFAYLQGQVPVGYSCTGQDWQSSFFRTLSLFP
ncbi:MAG: cation:proton antiporter [Lewinellaceae bacterium]|nr:cation:proton antiporter [Lewinellaceae bacterium]